jgi:uncharacterized protein YlxW (UPF0749 family)
MFVLVILGAMKSLNSLDAVIRLKRFEVEERSRKVAEIEATISDFNEKRANLAASVAGLESQLADARRELDEACEELKKIELLGERDTVRPVPDGGEAAA